MRENAEQELYQNSESKGKRMWNEPRKSHWSRQMMDHLKEQNMGWVKNILEKLSEYNLVTDWETIGKMSTNEWKEKVGKAVLKKNGEKLLENCITKSGEVIKINTKTRHIHRKLTDEIYKAEPLKIIAFGDKQRARTIFLSQNHMLECGKNMKSTIDANCNECQEIDDENHRLNRCKKWNTEISYAEFDDIFSNDGDKVERIITDIENKWELKFANGRMKK